MEDAIKKVSNRLRTMITKILVASVDDSTAIQLLKIKALDSEVIEGIERLNNSGFTSNPPENSEGLVAECAGARDNLVAFVIDSAANRVKGLLSGETCFYSKFGQQIKHDENGDTLHTATKHKFNDGGRKGAREDDPILVNQLTDLKTITWISTVSAAINSLVPGTIAPSAIPTTINGIIDDGSDSVELPND